VSCSKGLLNTNECFLAVVPACVWGVFSDSTSGIVGDGCSAASVLSWLMRRYTNGAGLQQQWWPLVQFSATRACLLNLHGKARHHNGVAWLGWCSFAWGCLYEGTHSRWTRNGFSKWMGRFQEAGVAGSLSKGSPSPSAVLDARWHPAGHSERLVGHSMWVAAPPL